MDSVKVRHSLYLILATLFWGTTFVAQSIAMDVIGPYTYNACRFFVGAIVLLPLAIITGRRDPLSVNYRDREKIQAAADHRARGNEQDMAGGPARQDKQDMAGGPARQDKQDKANGLARQNKQDMAGGPARGDEQDLANHHDQKEREWGADNQLASGGKGAYDHTRNAAWTTLLAGGFLTGLFLCLASSFQQVSLVYTTAGKCGFVTALYIIFVPAFGYLFFRKKCSPLVIAAIAVAVAGFYFLCITEQFTINRGDLIALGGSVMFAFQILTVDRYAPRTSPVQLSCVQFIVAGLLSLIPTFLLETPSWVQIRNCLGPILYAGVLSCGGGYTLQTIGQRGLNPTIASLFMSLESVISVLAGWLVLGDALSPREILGCLLVFSGVILAQIPLPGRAKK